MVAAGAPWARRILFALGIFQILSTLLGFVTLVFFGDMYQEALANTPFAGMYVLSGLFLGIVVGGFHWFAAIVHLRKPAWLGAAHALAGASMIGWIFGECRS